MISPVEFIPLLEKTGLIIPAGKWMLEALGLEPFLYADMRMGEGTGAAVAYPVLQAGFAEYAQLPTFADGSVKAYEHLR